MHRDPALDGVRGLAILSVLAYHVEWMPGGQHGVDVFFVLSGFLITRLLRRERELTGTVELGRFYRRRVARLAPALTIALAVSATAMLLRGETSTAATVAVGGSLYVGNYIVWLEPWGLRLAMMGPLWSLAVEEQFYLLWPVLFRRLRRPVPIIVAVLTTSMLLRVMLIAAGHEQHVYFSTETRAAGLLLGALVAFWQPTLTRPGAVAGLATGILGLVLITPVTGGWSFLLTLSAAELATALLLITVGSARFLALRPLVACGRVSYGMYVYSNVVLILYGIHEGDALPAPLQVAWIPTVFVVSWLSFHLIEQPVGRWIRRAGQAAEGARSDRATTDRVLA